MDKVVHLEPGGSKRPLLVPAVAVASLLLAAYSNSFSNAFHFDDDHVVVNNLYLRSLKNAGHFFTDAHTFSSQPTNATYRPLLSLSYALDYAIAGDLDVRQFHLTQFLLLLALGICVFLLFLHIFERTRSAPENGILALFGAAVFVLHPTNTETFNLISSRSDLLSTLFLVVALLFYVRGGALRRFHLYLIPFFLGGLVKASVVAFAPMLLSYQLLFEDDTTERWWVRLRRAVPAFAASAALLWFLDRMNAPEWRPGGGDVVEYLRTQIWVWVVYFRLFFFPVGLSADTDLRAIPSWIDPRIIAGALFVVALVWAVRKFSADRITRPVAFGLIWFALGLVPTSSIFPLGEFMNEHRIFLPYIGLALATSWAVALLSRREHLSTATGRKVVSVICVAAVVAFAAGTYQRNKVWKTGESLWLDVTRKSPGNGRGLMAYGLARMAAGDEATALQYFERSLRVIPDYVPLQVNLALVKDRLGDARAAERHFLNALRLKPADGYTHLLLCSLVELARSQPRGYTASQGGARLSPGFEPPRALLLGLYAARGSQQGLELLIEEIERIVPQDSTTALLRAVLFSEPQNPTVMMQRAQDAIAGRDVIEAAVACRAALRADSKSFEARNTLSWALITLGFLPEAIEVLEPLTREFPEAPEPKRNLARARTLLARTPPI
jgi:tetratricopeptide (TPR) repeat protein